MVLVEGAIVVYSLGVTVRMLSGHHARVRSRAWGACVIVRRKKQDEIDHLLITK